jgi:hypothetical protein
MELNLNDKTHLKRLREAIDENLAEFGRENGLMFHAGNISFEAGGDGCTVKLRVEKISAEPRHVRDFRHYANQFSHIQGHYPDSSIYPLKQEHLGCRIELPNGEVYTVAGLDPKRTKWPIVALSAKTGKLVGLQTNAIPYIKCAS